MIFLLEKVISDTLLLLLYFLPIFSDDIIYDVIFMINSDSMFTLDGVDIEEL